MHRLIVLLLLCVPSAGVARAQEDCEPRAIPVPDALDPTEIARFEAITKLQRKVWQTKVTFACKELPLDEALKQLSEVADCPLSGGAGLLVRAGTPVSVDVTDVSLHSTLIMMLRPNNLGYEVRARGVKVIRAFGSLGPRIVHFYETNGFLPPALERKPEKERVLGPFQDAIWEWETRVFSKNGGVIWGSDRWDGGTIYRYPNGIVVDGSPQFHWQVEQLVEQVNRAKGLSNDSYVTAALKVAEPVADPEQIARRLRTQRITFSQKNESLDGVIQALQDAAGIAVYVDRNAIGTNPLDVDWNGRTIWQALDEFTSQLKAGWRIVDDRVELTSLSKAESVPLIRVYPVRDLVWYGLVLPPEVKARLTPVDFGNVGFGGGTGVPAPNPLFDPELPALPNYRDLDDLLQSVHPNDRTTKVSLSYFKEADCVAIAATLEMHQEFERLLAEIRQNRRPIDSGRFMRYLDQVEAEPVTMTYYARRRGAEPEAKREQMRALTQRIREEIAPETWQAEDAYILLLNDRFVIRHRRDIQRKILAAIKDEKGLECVGSAFEGSYHW